MDHPLIWIAGGAAALFALNQAQTSNLVQQATANAQQQIAAGVPVAQAAQTASAQVVQKHMGGRRIESRQAGPIVTGPHDVVDEGGDIMTGGS